MDLLRLNRLRQIKINEPCHEDWEAMQGDEKRRFCGGCGCFVNNISAMGADEAESVLNQAGRICTRVQSDPQRGILTRDGWVARALTAGAVAVAMAGCTPTFLTQTGEAAGVDPEPIVDDGKDVPTGPTNPTPPIMGDISLPQDEPEPLMGEVLVPPKEPEPTMGVNAPPVEPQPEAGVRVGRIASPPLKQQAEPAVGKSDGPDFGT